MSNPYAPRVRRPFDPFPEQRLRDLGASSELVAYWRAAAGSLSDDDRAALYAEWRELSDDELVRDVFADVGDLPDPHELAAEYDDLGDELTVHDVPRNARDVVAWVGDARDSDDATRRAELALEVEQQRSTQRVTVLEATREVLGAA